MDFLPNTRTQRWILINEDMFKEAGLDIPYDGWTYSEFLTDAEKLTHGEGQDKGIRSMLGT